MPYLTKGDRNRIDSGERPKKPGEMNYALTRIIVDYIEWYGLNYVVINDVAGALENVKHEFFRRVADPYETRKMVQNGDVYPDWLADL